MFVFMVFSLTEFLPHQVIKKLLKKRKKLYLRNIRGIKLTALLMVLSSTVNASVSFNAGSLVFESESQSIWGTGASFNKEESLFLGAQWNNKTAAFGGIDGNKNQTITPAIPRALLTPAIPRTLLTPSIPRTLLTPAIPRTQITPAIPAIRDPFFGTIITPAIPAVYSPAIPAVYSPSIPAVYSPAIPAVYSPAIPAVIADTRTGVDLKIKSSGKAGIEFGYSINSGSVDSRVNFSALAELPDSPVKKDSFLNLQTNSVFKKGTIKTQSPEIEAYMSAILELSGSVSSTGCAIGFGCTSGSTSLPTIDVDQRILSVDPNSLKLLDGILPGNKPLAQIPLLNQSVTLSGGATLVPPAVGYKVKVAGKTVVDTLPPTPSLSVDLASITVKVPNIETEGSKSGNKISSTGRDDFLSAQVDIDGAASLYGGLPPAGISIDLIDKGGIKIGGSLDLIDVDAGPVLGITQDFELTPILMVDLEFSDSVKLMEGAEAILVDSWTGQWSDLPDLALLKTTTISPVFWLDAVLMTDIGLDLGLVGTLDLLKLSATGSVAGVDIIKFGPLTLNDILGIDNKLFETDKHEFSIYDDEFKLAGFNAVQGDSFVITVVPIPGAFWLFFAGLVTTLLSRHNLAPQIVKTINSNFLFLNSKQPHLAHS